MLKTAKKVSVKATTKALVSEYQNLNSGSLRMNGRNSSSCDGGQAPPCEALTRGAGGGIPPPRRPRIAPLPPTASRVLPPSRLGRRTFDVGSMLPSLSGSAWGDRNPINRFST